MSYEPLQPAPPPLEPTPLEPLHTSVPAAAPPSDLSPKFLAPRLPAGFMEPPPPTSPFSWRKEWPMALLALCYVGGIAFANLAGPQSPTSSAAWSPPSALASADAIIAELLLLIALGGVLLLDRRGYFSLRGWIQHRRTASDRLLVDGLLILFCLISLPIYFVRRFMGKPQERL